MADLKKHGVKTVLITEPFILKNTKTFEEVTRLELVGKTAIGKPYLYDFYFGHTALLDIFKPETKNWFWEIYKKHTLSGVDGWWGETRRTGSTPRRPAARKRTRRPRTQPVRPRVG